MVSVVVAAMTSAMVMLMAGTLGAANAQSLQNGAPSGPQSRALTILAFGDSLTAGYGLPGSAAFPAQLQKALEARGRKIVIQNAGVSGDTAQAGLDRLDWSIGDGIDGVIVELGANDALRGLDPAQTKAALDAILTRLKQRGLPVLLAGMLAPPNMGPAYRQRFDGLYAELAVRHGVALYPFFLDGVAGRRELNLPDGIHPTAQGVGVIVERMLPTIERWLDSIDRAR